MTTKQKRPHPRVYTNQSDMPSMTKQSFKDECNINKIMAKFQKTGAIEHYAKHAPTYGDATPIQLMDAQQIIINAQTMFDDLPATIRKKFDNDPAKFLEFVQDEANSEEMIELGLRAKPQIQQSDKQGAAESKTTTPKAESEKNEAGAE